MIHHIFICCKVCTGDFWQLFTFEFNSAVTMATSRVLSNSNRFGGSFWYILEQHYGLIHYLGKRYNAFICFWNIFILSSKCRSWSRTTKWTWKQYLVYVNTLNQVTNVKIVWLLCYISRNDNYLHISVENEHIYYINFKPILPRTNYLPEYRNTHIY